MKRIAIFAALIILLLAGGSLTMLITNQDGDPAIPGAKYQTEDPEASVFVASDWQAQQFFLLVGFILFNMVGIGATIALVMWFLSRQVAVAKATGEPASGGAKGRDIEPA